MVQHPGISHKNGPKQNPVSRRQNLDLFRQGYGKLSTQFVHKEEPFPQL